jgi:vancomycin permeability regulator SanA
VRALRLTSSACVAGCLLAAALIAGYGLHDEVARADLVVVPGNTVAPDGSPSPRLRARLDAAVQAYRDGVAPLVMVSGGTGVEGFDEAVSMATYLRGQGVPPEAVVVDSAGVDTAATADHAAAYLHAHGLRTAVVATQFFHVARMRLLLQQRDVVVVGQVHARFWEPRDAWSLARELPAFGVALVTGR